MEETTIVIDQGIERPRTCTFFPGPMLKQGSSAFQVFPGDPSPFFSSRADFLGHRYVLSSGRGGISWLDLVAEIMQGDGNLPA